MIVLKKASLSAALFAAAVLAPAANATPMQLVKNGGFENGLSNWSRSGSAMGQCGSTVRDWNVATSGSATGCTAVANPSGSTYAAYVMNDGLNTTAYKLWQDILVPQGTLNGTLSFNLSSYNSVDNTRKLSVKLLNTSGTVLFTAYDATTFSTSSAWTTKTADLSAFLVAHRGETLRLEFNNYMQKTWTGMAGLGLDNVSLNADVPEPTGIALLGLGALGMALSRRKRSVTKA